MATQLYNKDKKPIYPISQATAITSEASDAETVEDNLIELWSEVSKLSGAADASKNIVIKIAYARSTSSDRDEIKENGNWQT